MSFLKMVAFTIFHPFDAFYIIRRNKDVRARVWIALGLLLAAMLMRTLEIRFVSFSVQGSIGNRNLFLELMKLLVPFVSWVIISWLITSIMSGEAHFTQILAASSYSLTPYILATPLLIGISQLVSVDEKSLFQLVQLMVWGWVLLLFFISLMQLNNYGFMQTIGVAAVSLFAIVIMWAAILLILALTVQVVNSVSEFIKEVSIIRR